jgi:hypothetical protein
LQRYAQYFCCANIFATFFEIFFTWQLARSSFSCLFARVCICH